MVYYSRILIPYVYKPMFELIACGIYGDTPFNFIIKAFIEEGRYFSFDQMLHMDWQGAYSHRNFGYHLKVCPYIVDL